MHWKAVYKRENFFYSLLLAFVANSYDIKTPPASICCIWLHREMETIITLCSLVSFADNQPVISCHATDAAVEQGLYRLDAVVGEKGETPKYWVTRGRCDNGDQRRWERNVAGVCKTCATTSDWERGEGDASLRREEEGSRHQHWGKNEKLDAWLRKRFWYVKGTLCETFTNFGL